MLRQLPSFNNFQNSPAGTTAIFPWKYLPIWAKLKRTTFSCHYQNYFLLKVSPTHNFGFHAYQNLRQPHFVLRYNLSCNLRLTNCKVWLPISLQRVDRVNLFNFILKNLKLGTLSITLLKMVWSRFSTSYIISDSRKFDNSGSFITNLKFNNRCADNFSRSGSLSKVRS